jgi:hypothetical protein
MSGEARTQQRSERYRPGAGERLGQSAQHGQVGVKLDALQATNAQPPAPPRFAP